MMDLLARALALSLTPAALAQFGPETVVDTTSGSGFFATVTAADIDLDGDVDLASAFIGAEGVHWYANDGSGSFGPARVIEDSGPGSRHVRFGDLDGDGDLDAVASSDAADSISVYDRNGDGTFGPRRVIDARIDNVTQLWLIDLDEDGDLDVVGSYFCIDLIVWMENLGGGTFAPGVELVPTSNAIINTFEFADLDGDGDADLVLAVDSFSRTFMVASNQGGGVFSAPVTYSIAGGSGTTDVTPADVDGDGDLDLLIALETGAQGYRWQENEANGFTQSHVIDSGVNAWAIEAVDVDRDGDVDAVCVDQSGDVLSWYENEAGTFGDERFIDDYTGNVWAVAAADFDGDEQPDLATAIGFTGGRVIWYANESPRFEAYCLPAVPHSGGVTARLFASGTSELASNDVMLEATMLPPESLAMFLAGRSRAFVPGARGGAGTLCVGGALGRFLQPGRVTSADGFGAVYLSIDASSLPTSSGTAAAQAGETWHFQCWFRDPGAGPGGSNLTGGLSITFE